MALKPEATGTKSLPRRHEYRWQDVALYALGVGAKVKELDLLYEGRGPKVLPTYAVVPTFYTLMDLLPAVGGDPMGIVHGAQKVTALRPFAPSGTLTTVGTVAGVYDMKKLAVADFSTETRDDGGELVCTTEWSIIFRFDGGFDGPPPPRSERVHTPDRAPDFRVEEATAPEQAALYRLNGDLNPLHIDPKIGEAVGFGGPILHGLCTYGYAGRAIVNALCGGDPTRLRSLSGQFRKPVWPGNTIITEGWKEGTRVLLRTSTKERPEDYVFANATAELA